MQSFSRAVLQSKIILIMNRFSSHPGPRTTHQLEAVAESEHEIEHLRRVISPFVITVPGDIIYFKPERKDFRIAVFRTKSEVYMLSLIHISEPTRQAEISYAVFC